MKLPGLSDTSQGNLATNNDTASRDQNQVQLVTHKAFEEAARQSVLALQGTDHRLDGCPSPKAPLRLRFVAWAWPGFGFVR